MSLTLGNKEFIIYLERGCADDIFVIMIFKLELRRKFVVLCFSRVKAGVDYGKEREEVFAHHDMFIGDDCDWNIDCFIWWNEILFHYD